ncbi:MAG: hypothetical protein AAF675_21185 [Pseudomonadota bacterium]
MDSLIPKELSARLRADHAHGRGRSRVRLGDALAALSRAPLTAVSGGVRYGVMRLRADEIVVESAGHPPMRGTVDLFDGAARVARLLVQFAWERDGRAGYELKRCAMEATAAPVPHGARGVPAAGGSGGEAVGQEGPSDPLVRP